MIATIGRSLLLAAALILPGFVTLIALFILSKVCHLDDEAWDLF